MVDVLVDGVVIAVVARAIAKAIAGGRSGGGVPSVGCFGLDTLVRLSCSLCVVAMGSMAGWIARREGWGDGRGDRGGGGWDEGHVGWVVAWWKLFEIDVRE